MQPKGPDSAYRENQFLHTWAWPLAAASGDQLTPSFYTENKTNNTNI